MPAYLFGGRARRRQLRRQRSVLRHVQGGAPARLCHAGTLAGAAAHAAASALALLDGPIQLKAPPSAAQRALLIDPQTCGPLLAALAANQAPAALAAMRAAGFAQASVIGQVLGIPS